MKPILPPRVSLDWNNSVSQTDIKQEKLPVYDLKLVKQNKTAREKEQLNAEER